jgi:hypothetical protein
MKNTSAESRFDRSLHDHLSRGYNSALENIHNGKADTTLDQLRAAAEHPERLKTLSKLFISVDSSKPMTAIRNYWDKRPPLAQWSLMNLSHTPLALVTGYDFFELLVKCGFIDYKGHLNENPEIMEKKVQAMGGKTEFLLKYGVKFGKYLCPEVQVVEPFIAPLRKLHGIFAGTMDKIRGDVRAAREKREAVTNISADTRRNIQTQLN